MYKAVHTGYDPLYYGDVNDFRVRALLQTPSQIDPVILFEEPLTIEGSPVEKINDEYYIVKEGEEPELLLQKQYVVSWPGNELHNTVYSTQVAGLQALVGMNLDNCRTTETFIQDNVFSDGEQLIDWKGKGCAVYSSPEEYEVAVNEVANGDFYSSVPWLLW